MPAAGLRGQYGSYNVDICMVIDKTGSMSPILDTVKKNILNLHKDIRTEMESKGKHINRLRIRVIAFGDYKADDRPMIATSFLTMPDEEATLQRIVNGLEAWGGGDDPEDGLEALAFAIRSDWCKDSGKKRHIIALFTDAEPHELGACRSAKSYPKSGMPADFGELTEMWGDKDFPGEMDFHSKRLLLFAPRTTYWEKISSQWENSVIRDVESDSGLKDVTYQVMMNTIYGSI